MKSGGFETAAERPLAAGADSGGITEIPAEPLEDGLEAVVPDVTKDFLTRLAGFGSPFFRVMPHELDSESLDLFLNSHNTEVSPTITTPSHSSSSRCA